MAVVSNKQKVAAEDGLREGVQHLSAKCALV
jgi:hypothetical protein